MQPLTPAPLLNNKRGDNLIDQKRAAMTAAADSPSQQQYNQQQTKVKTMLKQFDLMHQTTDSDDEEDPFGSSNYSPANESTSMGILPLSKAFDPPPTISVGTQQKIGAEQQQIKASQMQNAQMGYSLSPPPLQQTGGMPVAASLAGTAQPFSYTPATTQPTDTTPLAATEGFHSLANWTNNQYGKYLGASTLAQSPTSPTNAMDVELYRLGGTATPAWATQKGGHISSTSLPPSWKPIAPINTADNDLLMTKLNYMINLLEEQKDEKTGNITEEIVLYSFLGVFMIFIVDSFSRVGKYVR